MFLTFLRKWTNIVIYLFNLTSPITNIPHLRNLDVDLNMPTDQNFNYYGVHDFHSSHDIIECSSEEKSFSALHCNIRSLSRNQDNFSHMLACLDLFLRFHLQLLD